MTIRGAPTGRRRRPSPLVTAPPTKLRLQPIPPSADWRFDLAEGCPAHCQYCYLAGSLAGPPVTRAYANLPRDPGELGAYTRPGRGDLGSADAGAARAPPSRPRATPTRSASSTSPARSRRRSGTSAHGTATVSAALHHEVRRRRRPARTCAHDGRTRIRFSVNAPSRRPATRAAPRALAGAARALRAWRARATPSGLTIAPILPVDGWRGRLRRAARARRPRPPPFPRPTSPSN